MKTFSAKLGFLALSIIGSAFLGFALYAQSNATGLRKYTSEDGYYRFTVPPQWTLMEGDEILGVTKEFHPTKKYAAGMFAIRDASLSSGTFFPCILVTVFRITYDGQSKEEFAKEVFMAITEKKSLQRIIDQDPFLTSKVISTQPGTMGYNPSKSVAYVSTTTTFQGAGGRIALSSHIVLKMGTKLGMLVEYHDQGRFSELAKKTIADFANSIELLKE